ncbi:MAG: SMI1/KNR4 family protein [Gracilibacteraceae bacterium]|nr:SMI1/KNR4 family protein [Gracilibacteraceae bacterium]
MFRIKSIEEIKKELFGANAQVMNFPKAINFPFDELYKEIVTKIKTTEISSECILYNSVYSANMTKAYADEDYWSKNTVNAAEDAVRNYWFIGQNGQGDYWIMDINGKIYFYDHDNEEIDVEKIINLNIDFGKWLQYAYLNKELDEIYFGNKYNETIGEEYKKKLKEISKELFENYPFDDIKP